MLLLILLLLLCLISMQSLTATKTRWGGGHQLRSWKNWKGRIHTSLWAERNKVAAWVEFKCSMLLVRPLGFLQWRATVRFYCLQSRNPTAIPQPLQFLLVSITWQFTKCTFNPQPKKMWKWKRIEVGLECPAADGAYVWWISACLGFCVSLLSVIPPKIFSKSARHSISLSLGRWQGTTSVEVSCRTWGFWRGLSLREAHWQKSLKPNLNSY